MALKNPYCSVAQVQGELRNTSLALESTLENAINAASRFIDRWKGRDYFLHDYSTLPLTLRFVSGAFLGEKLLLPYYPIIELTSVTVNDEAWTLDTDYVLHADSTEIICLDGSWPVRHPTDTVELVGKFGYDQAAETDIPTNLPAEINQAAILIAAAFSGHNQKEQVGVDGVKAQVIDKNIPQSALKILGPRRLVVS